MEPPPPLDKPISEFPVHFALLLFPSFQALDVFGPLDALNLIKRLYPSLLLRLSILSTSLSPVSTFPSPSSTFIPFEQQINPTHTFASPPSEPIDILFIPGGIGTRATEEGWKPLVEYLTTFFATPSSIGHLKGIFTVCTGSILLGRSKLPNEKGTLDGVRATTNKNMFFAAKGEMPDVLWEPKARWVRTDRLLPCGGGRDDGHKVKLWTTSGVSAGIDGMFALIDEEYGTPVAEFIARGLEYVRATDPNDDPFGVEVPDV